jgi:hypothetical protein
MTIHPFHCWNGQLRRSPSLSSQEDEKSVNRARGLQRSEHYSTFGGFWLTIIGCFAVKMMSRETESVHILALRA